MDWSVRSESIAARTHGTYLIAAAPLLAAAPQAGGAPPLLVGFHGYGESAERHLAELQQIPGAVRWLLVAVQALHPFYNRTGEVVASWMTKHDREHAIEDNVHYVAEVVSRLRRDLAPAGPLVYAGFSQGVATAYRAAAGAGHPCHGVIALGGDVPPELAERDLAGFPPVLLGRGRAEEWYGPAKMDADVDILRGKGIDVRPFHYDGGHEWTDPFRHAAGDFLDEVLRGGTTPTP